MAKAGSGTLVGGPTSTGSDVAPEGRRAMLEELVDHLSRLRKVALLSPDRAAEMGDRYNEVAALTLHQLEALSCVSQGVTMGEFARCMRISDSAATALAGRLVKAGLVERVASDNDRRVVRLVLSERARSLLEDFRRSRDKAAQRLFARLDDASLAHLVEILRLVLAASEEGSQAEVRP